MSITSIPLQTESAGQLGKSKTDGTGVYDADTKISAAQWNQMVLRMISVFQEVGLSDGSTASSLRKALNDLISGGTNHNALHVNTDADVQGSFYVGGDLTLVGGVNSLVIKDIVRLATTANGTLATAFANGQTLDGKTLATGDRILLKNQSTAAENGIYTVNASGAPTRSYDCNAAADLIHGLVVPVASGDANAGHVFVCTAITAVPGSTALTFYDVIGPATFPTPRTISGTTYTLTDLDNGVTLRCTNAAGCTITVPDTLTPGFSCSAFPDHATGSVIWGVSGSMVLHNANGFLSSTTRYGVSGVIAHSTTLGIVAGAVDS